METLLEKHRLVAIADKEIIDKDHFDENFGFRNVPGLFTSAFKDWFVTKDGNLITIRKPSFLECWYEKHIISEAPAKPSISDGINSANNFRKNIWDLGSYHFLDTGEANWLLIPPAILQFLDLTPTEANLDNGLEIDLDQIFFQKGIKLLSVTQKAGELLYIPPFYAYSKVLAQNSIMVSRTILTEFNHDNLYAYFRVTESKKYIKQIILEGFKNTKHLSKYETPNQRKSVSLME